LRISPWKDFQSSIIFVEMLWSYTLTADYAEKPLHGKNFRLNVNSINEEEKRLV
jgi:hypothetical protein